MIEKKLRACPFCKSDAQIVSTAGMFPRRYTVVCVNTNECGASIGGFCLTKAEAANKWNSRMPKIAHEGCGYCPVGCTNYEQDHMYRGSSCAAARAKAGVDYDPENVFVWEDDPLAEQSGKEVSI